MPHAEKTCDPCGARFTPGEFLSAEQAAITVSCSHFCSSARIQGRPVNSPRRAGDSSDAVGTLDASGRCICSDCNRIRAEDRSPLIARIAAERGVGVATGPRARRSPKDLAKIAARKRQASLESPGFPDLDNTISPRDQW